MMHARLCAYRVPIAHHRALHPRADLDEVEVADPHGLASSVDDDRVLLDDVVRPDEDGPRDGEYGGFGVDDRTGAYGDVAL